MSKKAVLIGDIGTSHDDFPPSSVISGSSTVKFDNKSVARIGDSVAMHTNPHGVCHSRHIASGSSTVFIENKGVARTQDNVSCGGVLIGNSTINID